MGRFATVRVRVTLAAVMVVGVALAAGGALLVQAHRDSLTQNIETAARLRSRDIASTITDGAFPSKLAVPHGDENLVQVVDASGAVVAASTNIDGEARISTLQPGEDNYAARSVDHLRAGEGPFRVIARRVVTKSGTFTVYVAGASSPSRTVRTA